MSAENYWGVNRRPSQGSPESTGNQPDAGQVRAEQQADQTRQEMQPAVQANDQQPAAQQQAQPQPVQPVQQVLPQPVQQPLQAQPSAEPVQQSLQAQPASEPDARLFAQEMGQQAVQGGGDQPAGAHFQQMAQQASGAAGQPQQQQPQPQQAQQQQPQPQPQLQPQQQVPKQPQPQPQPQFQQAQQQQARQQYAQQQYAAPQPGQPQYQAAYAGPMPYPAQPVSQGKSHGWIVAIVAVVCLFAFAAFAVSSCSNAMMTLPTSVPSSPVDDIDGDTIGVIDIDGTIQYDGTLCSPEGLKKMLDEAQDNSHIKAIVLRVNSGGGTATAGEEMAEYLREFNKPVVVSSASINASAAYEISAQADYIYVAKSTEIGAIGTVMQMTDLSGLLDKLGVKMDTIASADSKDSSYGYRSLTDEEREYYQKMVDQINDMFIDNVAQGRKMEVEDVRKLATGLVFTGVDAVENGLADEVGTREDAVKKAAELAGISSYETVNLVQSTYDLSSFAYLFGESRSTADELLDMLNAEGRGQAK